MKRFPACILATCVLPWDESGEFIEPLFRDQVERLLALTRHLYIFGTAGEGYAVTDEQFERITRVYCDVMKNAGADTMVGVISLSLPTIIGRIDRARKLGVRQFQISLPSWGALTDDETRQFFRETCARFPDCQFLHYNLMRAKRLITPEQYAELADEHPNLVATKNSTDSMDRLSGLMRLSPVLQHFPTETGFVFASQLGECGLLASVSAIHWESCREFFAAGGRRDVSTLSRLHREMEEITAELLAAAGPDVHMDAAFDKMLWRLQDERFPLRLLPPYCGATETAFGRFAEVVRTRFPHWVAGHHQPAAR
jgi:dihydrodipicolinate synthase/N-acetylneuraminate lyase